MLALCRITRGHRRRTRSWLEWRALYGRTLATSCCRGEGKDERNELNGREVGQNQRASLDGVLARQERLLRPKSQRLTGLPRRVKTSDSLGKAQSYSKRLEASRQATTAALAAYAEACGHAGEEVARLAVEKTNAYIKRWRGRLLNANSCTPEKYLPAFGDSGLYAALIRMAADVGGPGGRELILEVISLMAKEGLTAQGACLAQLLRACTTMEVEAHEVSSVLTDTSEHDVIGCLDQHVPLDNDRDLVVQGAERVLWSSFQPKDHSSQNSPYESSLLKELNARDTSR